MEKMISGALAIVLVSSANLVLASTEREHEDSQTQLDNTGGSHRQDGTGGRTGSGGSRSSTGGRTGSGGTAGTH